ncbi:hypothetical protein [Niabella ginsengisoli]|uniref:Uncharacterized protein n=1 Tax=Niabella ginsengisoli TaxID=522298 RepID=A0ABS9SG51_9BACT|nr:hypothetical protein [Niabella ginsengisoli]MCH5597342.1 hypothetical protein [Niabella ginsengisoli]
MATSRAELACEIVEQMMKRGFLLNLGIFPAVSHKHSGVRFTITVLQSFECIEQMVNALNEEFADTLKRHHYSVEQIKIAFKTIVDTGSASMN